MRQYLIKKPAEIILSRDKASQVVQEFEVTAGGSVVDLSNYKVAMIFRRNDFKQKKVEIEATPVILDAKKGLVSLILSPATITIGAGKYTGILRLISSEGVTEFLNFCNLVIEASFEYVLDGNNIEPYLLQIKRIDRRKHFLDKFKKGIYSQDGEDGILKRIFELLNPINRYCVDVGAHDGIHFSNSRYLINKCGWTGCLIEGDQERFSKLKQTYKPRDKLSLVNKYVTSDGTNSLDHILISAEAPLKFDLLLIDVDGMDYFIWESFVRFIPSVVLIEFNPTVPNDVIFVQAKKSNINHGCSLLALIGLASRKGYELLYCTSGNAIFVKSEFFDEFGSIKNDINSIYAPKTSGRIWQGYDSYLYTAGMNKLVWDGDCKFDNIDLQVQPRFKHSKNQDKH